MFMLYSIVPHRIPPRLRLPRGVRVQVGPIPDDYREGGGGDKAIGSRRATNIICFAIYPPPPTTTTTTDFFAARDHDNFSNDSGVDHSCVVNASIGSRPGHPVVDAFLERLLINVRTSRYGGDAGPACAVRSMPPVLAASSVWPFTMRMRRRGMTTERGSRISPGGTRRGHPGSATSGGRERTPCNTNAPIAGGIRIGATMATLQ